jgi:heavy metal sensor kinase
VRRALKSINGRIFFFLLSFTSLLLITAGFFFYYKARELAFDAVDRTLHSKAQVISGLIHRERNAVKLEVAEVILGEYSIPRSGHYYKVLMDDRLLAASPSLVDGEFNFGTGTLHAHNGRLRENVYTSVGPDGEPIRVLRKDLAAMGSTFHVLVAESLEETLAMISSFRNFLLLVIPSGVVIVCMVGWWIAKMALKPLSAFSGRVSTITHKTLGERIDSGAETVELKGLALAFNNMLDRLKKAFDSERRLVADASHELKTPVSVIRAECDVTLQRERSREEYVETIKSIREVTASIDGVVRDLLSLARLDSGILDPADFLPLSINECLGKMIAMMTMLAEEKHVEIMVDFAEDLRVRGNREILAEAFLNLFENGIKYNRANGVLEVSTMKEGEKAVISIRDTGPGIREDERERVFDRFYRSDAVRGAEGTGLGLSITRAIIEAHGGEIRVESELGVGSTFIVTLPVSGSQE